MSDFKPGFEIPKESIKKTFNKATSDSIDEFKDDSRKGFFVDSKLEAREIRTSEVPHDELTTITMPNENDNEEVTLKTRFWTSPIFMLLLLIITVGGLQVYELISSAFEKSTIAGWCWSGGISLALFLVILSVFRELTSVWKLKNTYESRQSYSKIIQSGNNQDAVGLCRKITTNEPASKKRLEAFLKKVKPNFSVEECFDIYEREVLGPLDKKAQEIVVKRSRETAVVVALSPIAWLDMTFSLARSLRMVREIAEVYGFHCGLWGRFELYRKIIRNVVFIGIADLTTDAITDAVGAKTFAKFSAAVGQGLAAGIYSTRLGYMTIKAIRPLPVSRDKLKLGTLRKEMLTGVLSLLNKDKSSE